MVKSSYFRADDVFIYPSSNASDGGATNSEENLVSLVNRIATSNYVVAQGTPTYDEDSPLAFKINGNTISVNNGECSINGYLVRVENSPVFDLSQYIDPTDSTTAGSQYTVALQLVFDGAGHVRGDGENIATHEMECWGFLLGIYKAGDEALTDRPGLTLGDFTVSAPKDGVIQVSQINYNENKYSFIDSSVVKNTSGVPLDTWVVSQLLNLDRVRYSSSEITEDTPDTEISSVRVDEQGLWIKLGDSAEYNLLKRFVMAEKGGLTPAGTKGKKTDTNNGSTAGNSVVNDPYYYICRADHDHDKRYLLTSTALTEGSQDIGTGLNISGDFSVADDFFVEKYGNGVRVRKGSFTVDSDGNVGTANLNSAGPSSLASGVLVVERSTDSPSGNAGATLNGDFTATGTITGSKVYNAVWNDYAELYLKDDPDETYESGTVICKVRGKDTYAPSSDTTSKLVVGVVSDSYGILLGGDKDKTEEENLKKYVPVAMSGRVKVKVAPNAVVEEGDLLYASAFRGKAVTSPHVERGTIVGKALESSDGDKDKILMQVMLG